MDDTTEDQNKKDFDAFMSMRPDIVRKNVKVVTPETLGSNFLLHIDPIPVPKVFIPRMPSSAAMSENPHVPRITVSDSIIGCMVGYSRIEVDFIYNHVNGWVISKFEFDYALEVNPKMVYDADYSNEHWLVTYNKETVKYKPIRIGCMFLRELNFTANDKTEVNDRQLTLYIEIESDDTVKISDDVSISKGTYKLMTNRLKEKAKQRLFTYVSPKVEAISSSEFNTLKKQSISMLDTSCVNIPITRRW
jgi:hypothetical protein